MSSRGQTTCLQWPPAPSVEEDSEGDDSSVNSRGTIDQYPIILNADEPFPSYTASNSTPLDGSNVRGRSSNGVPSRRRSIPPTLDAGRRNVDNPDDRPGKPTSTEQQKRRNRVTFSEDLDDRGRHPEQPSLTKIDTYFAGDFNPANGAGRRRPPPAYTSMKSGIEKDSTRRHSAEIYSAPGVETLEAQVQSSERSTSESTFHRYMTSVNAREAQREKTRSSRNSSRAPERRVPDERKDYTLAWYSEDDTSSSRHRRGSVNGDKRINIRDKSRAPADIPLPYTSSDESDGETRRRSRSRHTSSQRPSRDVSSRRYPPTQPKYRFPESNSKHPYDSFSLYDGSERQETSSSRDGRSENPRQNGWPSSSSVASYGSQSMTPSRLAPQSPVQASTPWYSNAPEVVVRMNGQVIYTDRPAREGDRPPRPPPIPAPTGQPTSRARALTSPVTTDGRARTFSPPNNDSRASPIDDGRSTYASDDGCGRPSQRRIASKQHATRALPPPTNVWVQRPLPDPSKSQLARCPRSIPIAGYQDWYTISGLTHLDICPSCVNQISGSPFREFLIPGIPKRRDVKARCSLSDPWVRLAWLQTIKQQHGNLDMLYQVTKPRPGNKPCPGRDTSVQSWYRVVDPESGRSTSNFDACSSCVRSIRIIFPSLHEVFERPSTAPVQERLCDLRTDSPRFARYVELLDEAAASTNSSQRRKGRDRSRERSRDRSRDRRSRRSSPPQPDMREFIHYARRKSTLASCPRDRLVQAQWHFIPELPEFTICEDCYDDVVYPLAHKSIAGLVSRTRQCLPTTQSPCSSASSSSSHSCSSSSSTCSKPTVPRPRAGPIGADGNHEASCQLYSPRMRAKFREAVQWGDLGYLKSVALRRYEVEGLFREQKSVLLEDMERGYDRDMEMRRNAEEWKKTWE